MNKEDMKSIGTVAGLAILFFSPFVYHVVHQKYIENKKQKNRARIECFIDYSLNRMATDAIKYSDMFDDYYTSPEHTAELRQDSIKYADKIQNTIRDNFRPNRNFNREFNRIFGANTSQPVKRYKHICYELELSRRAKQK